MSRYKITCAVLIGILLTYCKKDDGPSVGTDQEIQVWLDSAGIVATQDPGTGIYFYPTATSTGAQVSPGNVAAIYYSLSDLDGNVIAAHQRANGDSLLLKVGASAVYPVGVDFGVSQMRVGEVFTFILPPAQAYASLTSGAINRDLIAVMTIELTAVYSEADLFARDTLNIRQYINDNFLDSLEINPADSTIKFPNGIVYKRRRTGLDAIPTIGDTVIVDFAGRFLDEGSFDAADGFEWIFGSGEPRELLSGFEFGVSLMQTNESALFMLPSAEAYRESALIIPDFITADLIADDIIPDYVQRVPPYHPLLFEITRVD